MEDFDIVEFLTEFCLNEIALEGLQGCELGKLFDLLKKSSSQLSQENDSNKFTQVYRLLLKQEENFKNFVLNILINNDDISFYTIENIEAPNTSKKSHTKSLALAKNKNQKYEKIINSADQKGYCPNFFERKLINIDYKISYEGFINKYKNVFVVASQQLRNKVLCPSFKYLDFENLNDLEYCVLESIARSRYDGIHSTGDNGLVQQFDLVPKQLHYILGILESHGLIKKQVLTSEKKKSIIHLTKFSCKVKSISEKLCDYLIRKTNDKNKDAHSSNEPYSDTAFNLKKFLNISNKQFKTLIQTAEKQSILKRYFTTVEATFKKYKTSSKLYSKNRQVRMIKLNESYVKQYLSNQEETSILLDEDENSDEVDTSNILGTAQSNDVSLYTQIFNKIDQCGKEGISLKQIGHLFGFDFYKSRRMGSNLQTHPDIVTMIKETNRGKAKYQTIFLRKYLIDTKKSTQDEITILPQKNIQALVSNRMLNRKKIVQEYLEKNKICTKYELTREIREQEEKLGLKGAIDSKTTKRMLLTLENESKLKIFTVNLKSTSYMGVRLPDLSEDDDLFKNYCATFKRTFDTVDVKMKKPDEPDPLPETTFKLTKKYISSIVEHLEFSTNFSKKYALVPKFQKAIILHRFLNYILFFYDGIQQSTEPNPIPDLIDHDIKYLDDSDVRTLQNCSLPTMDKLYQPVENNNNCLKWNSFIPKLKRNNDKECIFIGDIFSHMPLSIFCSLIVINHQVPGLVAVLKHPQKRHLLVKDLPPELIAPLIFERRYLQRILAILQLLACLGLVTFIESPFKNNQAFHRDVQSQMIYVHRKAIFYDTSINKCTDWIYLKDLNLKNLKNDQQIDLKYEKCSFDFNSDIDVVEYWRRLLHISMNTYKFSVGKYLHESKKLRQELLNKIVNKIKLNEIEQVWPIEKYGDHMGPGLYDSQLFLNSFKNWMVSPTNLNNSSSQNQVITKEADQSFAPYSELALFFPFGVMRGLASTTAPKKKPSKRKPVEEKPKKKIEFRFKKAKLLPKINSNNNNNNDNKINININSNNNIKQNLIKTARHLVDKAKLQSQKIISTSQACPDHRATWTRQEDEMILLVKVTALYFLPNEKSVPFKLINDVMNLLMPKYCRDKRVSSFGRRVKILMKSKMNCLFVANKLELCKQDKDLEKKYSNQKIKIKRNLVDKEMVELYVSFILDIKEKLKNSPSNSVNDQDKEEAFEMPNSLEEFNKKYKILNTQKDLLFKNPASFYQQPKTDYEIMCNTIHSAIHSSILINDKNPRVFESFNLFDKYSDQLLTDVITRMSVQHKIIAPTKYSELKKKNVTAFSKHIGKAYHISQRYQYKWINTISTNVLNDTNKFKNDFVKSKLDASNSDQMFDCTDRDDLGMTSFLAHTIDNTDIQVQIDVPNKIWVSKLI